MDASATVTTWAAVPGKFSIVSWVAPGSGRGLLIVTVDSLDIDPAAWTEYRRGYLTAYNTLPSFFSLLFDLRAATLPPLAMVLAKVRLVMRLRAITTTRVPVAVILTASQDLADLVDLYIRKANNASPYHFVNDPGEAVQLALQGLVRVVRPPLAPPTPASSHHRLVAWVAALAVLAGVILPNFFPTPEAGTRFIRTPGTPLWLQTRRVSGGPTPAAGRQPGRALRA